MLYRMLHFKLRFPTLQITKIFFFNSDAFQLGNVSVQAVKSVHDAHRRFDRILTVWNRTETDFKTERITMIKKYKFRNLN